MTVRRYENHFARSTHLLNQYRWPSSNENSRNLIYRSAVLAQGEMILIKDLPQEVVQAIEGGSAADTTGSSVKSEIK